MKNPQDPTPENQNKSFTQRFREWIWEKLKDEVNQQIKSELKPIQERLNALETYTSERTEFTWRDRLGEYSLRESLQYQKRLSSNNEKINDPKTSQEEQQKLKAENVSIQTFLNSIEKMNKAYDSQSPPLSSDQISQMAKEAIDKKQSNSNSEN